MDLSKDQLSSIAEAMGNHTKELLFIQKPSLEQKQIHNSYNYVKFQEFEAFQGELLPVALEVKKELWDLIDRWVDSKKQSLFYQALNDDELDLEDILFITSIASVVNGAVASEYNTETLNKRISSIYDNSASYYTNKEFNSLLNYLKSKGFTVIRTGDEVSITPPRHYPVDTTIQVTLPLSPRFSFTNPEILKYYNEFTLPAITGLGEKYSSLMETTLKDGFNNDLSINKISENLKALVDPENNSNQTFYFYQRIAYGESAFYSETGKNNSFKSLNISQVLYLTAGDSRVCPKCLPDHLKIFLITELVSPPPRHVWCRCTLVPIYRYNDLLTLLMPAVYALLLLYDDDRDDDKYANLHSYETDEPT